MDRIWLKQYPAGVPTDIDAGEYSSIRELFEEACAEHRQPAGVLEHGRDPDIRPARHLERRVRGLAAAQIGARTRRPGRADDAEHPAISRGAVRRAARGHGRRQHQPALHRARARASAADSGAKAIVILENFAHVLQQVLPRTELKNVLVTGVGDSLGLPRGAIVNFVLRHVRKQVPAWTHARLLALQERAAGGLAAGSRAGAGGGGRHRVPAVHGRHDRRRQSRDPHPSQHGRERAAGERLDQARPDRRSRTRS